MIRYGFAVVSVIGLIAAVGLVLLFSDSVPVGLAQFSVDRCVLPVGFESGFSSSYACMNALVGLCSQQCSVTGVRDCVFKGKRQCENIGVTQVRVFG